MIIANQTEPPQGGFSFAANKITKLNQIRYNRTFTTTGENQCQSKNMRPN